jgi:hypothetical protein
MTAGSNPLSTTVNNVTHIEHDNKNLINHKNDRFNYAETPVTVPPLGNLRRSLDLSQIRTPGNLLQTPVSVTNGGNSSNRKRVDPRKKTVDNRFLQIQIQCSSALDKQGYRHVSTAV